MKSKVLLGVIGVLFFVGCGKNKNDNGVLSCLNGLNCSVDQAGKVTQGTGLGGTHFSFAQMLTRVPNDGVCRLRYTTDQGYVVLSGRNRTHSDGFAYLSSAESHLKALTDEKICK